MQHEAWHRQSCSSDQTAAPTLDLDASLSHITWMRTLCTTGRPGAKFMHAEYWALDSDRKVTPRSSQSLRYSPKRQVTRAMRACSCGVRRVLPLCVPLVCTCTTSPGVVHPRRSWQAATQPSRRWSWCQATTRFFHQRSCSASLLQAPRTHRTRPAHLPVGVWDTAAQMHWVVFTYSHCAYSNDRQLL